MLGPLIEGELARPLRDFLARHVSGLHRPVTAASKRGGLSGHGLPDITAWQAAVAAAWGAVASEGAHTGCQC